MLSTIQVANYFIKKGIEDSNPVTPMKLIKLCYIAQGVYLVAHNEKLFDGNFEAWKYGPVAPSLYQEFKDYGDKVVSRYGGELVLTNDSNVPDYPHVSKSDKNILDILDMVWDQFKSWTATELSAWTHREGSAWSFAIMKGMNAPIPDDALKREFSKVIQL